MPVTIGVFASAKLGDVVDGIDVSRLELKLVGVFSRRTCTQQCFTTQ